MTKQTARLVLSSYQLLPEWLARVLAFIVVSALFAAGIAFLSARPNIRRLGAVRIRNFSQFIR